MVPAKRKKAPGKKVAPGLPSTTVSVAPRPRAQQTPEAAATQEIITTPTITGVTEASDIPVRDDDVGRLVATAIARIDQGFVRWRSKVQDRDHGTEAALLDLFRDLAVMLGLSYRSFDWEGADEPDPLVRLAAIQPLSINGEDLTRRLRGEVFEYADANWVDRPQKSFALAHSSEDAVTRLIGVLRVQEEEGFEAITEFLEPTRW